MLSSEPGAIVSIFYLLNCDNGLHFRQLEPLQEQIQYQTYILISISCMKIRCV